MIEEMKPAVPRRYADARFATFQRKGPSIQSARTAVGEWIEDVVAGDAPMTALVGPKGTGKSHLLACAAWDLYETYGVYAACRRWYLVADALRDIETARATRDGLRGARVLILDEVRPTSGTDFDAMELAKIALWAYDERQAVLLATNWPTLEDLVGEPAADRFRIVNLDGDSAR